MSEKEDSQKKELGALLNHQDGPYGASPNLKILFDAIGNPIKTEFIKKCIAGFGESYNSTVQTVIPNSGNGIDEQVFHENVARLMPNFKMTRQGPFKGAITRNRGSGLES